MAQRRFSFILPADWWRIPLAGKEQRYAAISNLLDHQFPSKDELAQLRQEVRTELRKHADQAAAVGGLITAVYLAQFDEHPISATMTCYDLSGVMMLPPEIDPRELLTSFVGDNEMDASPPPLGAALLPDGGASSEAQETSDERVQITVDSITVSTDATRDDAEPWSKVTDYNVLAYRRKALVKGVADFGDAAAKIPTLQFTYFQVVPDFGLVQTVFGTPISGPADAWEKMFDAIVATFRNGTPPQPGTSATDSPNEVSKS